MSVDKLLARIFSGAAFLLVFLASEYHLTILVYIGLSAIVALGLVLLTGKAGLASFGQAAYVGIGAYITAVLCVKYGWSPWVTLPTVLLVTFIGSLFGAHLTVRLSGHYLPLATIAFAVATYYLFGALTLTGGQTGLGDIPRLSIAGFELQRAEHFYLVTLSLLALTMKGLANLLDSRMGRAIRALASGAIMPEAMGIDSHAVKAGTFVIACLLAAFVGWFYAHFQQFINPTSFSLNQGVEYLFMAVLGGAQSLWGAVVGATLVTTLKQALQQILPGIIGFGGNFEVVVFGVLVILMFQFAPEGLIPGLRRLMRLPEITARPTPHAEPLPKRAKLAPHERLLVAEDVSKAFGGIRANDGISLELRSGEVLSLIGPNGAGKSTFFALLSGLLPLDRGEVRFRDEVISGRSPRQIALVGLNRTFQHVRLVGTMSAIENVALGGHRRGRMGMLRAIFRLDRDEEKRVFAEAMRQLERVGMADFAWTAAGNLALGQQRILEIARALMADPQALLLDEPAAGLRHKEKEVLAALLSELRADGLGILLVEHDMPFVMNLSDRIVVLDYGQKIAEGDPARIRADSRVLEAYLGAA